MLKRFFGTNKKGKSSKTQPRDHPSADGICRHKDPMQPEESTPVATTRTTSPTMGRRNRNSFSENKAASSPSRSSVQTLGSPSSPNGSASIHQSYPLPIRSDPVPVGFKNTNNPTNSACSPLSLSTNLSFNSPISQQSQGRGKQEWVLPNMSNANGLDDTAVDNGPNTNKSMNSSSSSRPAVASCRLSSLDPQLSRTAPVLCSSPLLSSTHRSNNLLANNNSLASGGDGAAGGAGAGSTVNYWRLPWTQQKVAMCPYCNRLIRQERVTQMNSKEFFVDDSIRSDIGADLSKTSSCSDSSSSSSGSSSNSGAYHPGLDSPSATYCRCGVGSTQFALGPGAEGGEASGATTKNASFAQPRSNGDLAHSQPPPPPPVFIVETERSLNIVVPGTIADNSSSSSEDSDTEGNHRSVKLSLVSPLTSSTLLRNASSSVPAAGRNGHGKAAASPMLAHSGGFLRLANESENKGQNAHTGANAVSSWVQTQRRQQDGPQGAELGVSPPPLPPPPMPPAPGKQRPMPKSSDAVAVPKGDARRAKK